MQRDTRRKIGFGQYYPNTKLSRVNYATGVIGYIKELELSYSDEKLINKRSYHFEQELGHALKGQQAKTKSSLFKVLADDDNDDIKHTIKQYREQTKSENKDNES